MIVIDDIKDIPTGATLIQDDGRPNMIKNIEPYIIEKLPELYTPFMPDGKERSRFKRNQKWGGRNR